ncbi:MAG: TIGR03619 family F420-dependent LLM class oxidoreductase [Actinomycetota bacterium]|nr:TIGR03619 family F420-dependent LLM class oxidoreductase [Actinomycetota bacterium]
MKFWLIAPWVGPEEMIELARSAEALGYEGIMGADHGFVPKTMAAEYLYSDDGRPPIDGSMPYPDVWTTITAMAMATERLKLSTAVYVLPLRHPIEVAKATGTIARISGGRLILGAGAGWMKEEFDVYGVDFETRGRRMDESVEVMRKLWAGGYVEHHGEFFDFPELAITPAPDAPVPIYFGGTSRAALRRAARTGQGWIGAGNSIDEVPAILEELRGLRREYGREEEAFEVVCPVMQVMEIDRLKELEAQGLTSICFGFANDYAIPLNEKQAALKWFADEVMSKL